MCIHRPYMTAAVWNITIELALPGVFRTSKARASVKDDLTAGREEKNQRFSYRKRIINIGSAGYGNKTIDSGRQIRILVT